MNLSEIRADHFIVYCWQPENDATYVKVGKSKVNTFHKSVVLSLSRFSPYRLVLLGIEVFDTDKEARHREMELINRFDRLRNTEWVLFNDDVKVWLDTCIEPPPLEFFGQKSEVRKRNRKYMKGYQQQPENKEREREYQREYRQKPKNKERSRKRSREYQRKYRKRPEVKEREREYQKEYLQRPEVKEHKQKYYEKRSTNPEYREYQRQYDRKRYAKKRKARPVSSDTLDLF